MIRILFTRFLLGNLSSCALAATVSHRVGVGADRINKRIPATRNRSLRLLPLHVLSAAIHLREVSNLLERLGCHRHLRRADSMLRKHYRDLQNNPPQTDTSTNAAPLYHTDFHIRRHPN